MYQSPSLKVEKHRNTGRCCNKLTLSSPAQELQWHLVLFPVLLPLLHNAHLWTAQPAAGTGSAAGPGTGEVAGSGVAAAAAPAAAAASPGKDPMQSK